MSWNKKIKNRCWRVSELQECGHCLARFLWENPRTCHSHWLLVNHHDKKLTILEQFFRSIYDPATRTYVWLASHRTMAHGHAGLPTFAQSLVVGATVSSGQAVLRAVAGVLLIPRLSTAIFPALVTSVCTPKTQGEHPSKRSEKF